MMSIYHTDNEVDKGLGYYFLMKCIDRMGLKIALVTSQSSSAFSKGSDLEILHEHPPLKSCFRLVVDLKFIVEKMWNTRKFLTWLLTTNCQSLTFFCHCKIKSRKKKKNTIWFFFNSICVKVCWVCNSFTRSAWTFSSSLLTETRQKCRYCQHGYFSRVMNLNLTEILSSFFFFF